MSEKNSELHNYDFKADMLTLKTDMKEAKEDISELKEDVSVLKTDMDEVKEDITIMQANIGSLDSQMKEVKSELRKLSGSVAVIEKEHGDKLNLILDMIREPFRNVKSMENAISSHDDQLYEHDIRIQVLEKASNS